MIPSLELQFPSSLFDSTYNHSLFRLAAYPLPWNHHHCVLDTAFHLSHPVMATVLCLAALCWLMGPAVQGAFLQSRSSVEYPDTWSTAVVPKTGIYVISARVDGNYTRLGESYLKVKVNGKYLFVVFAVGTTCSGAMALKMRRRSNVTVDLLGNPPSSAKNSLTVCFIHRSPHYVSLKLGMVSRRFNYGSNVVFRDVWRPYRWTHPPIPGCTYIIQRDGLYWVMAQSYPNGINQPVDVRFTRPEHDNFQSLFAVWTDKPKPSFCAGAFYLTAGGLVYMTGQHSYVRVYSSTMLSLVELIATGPM